MRGLKQVYYPPPPMVRGATAIAKLIATIALLAGAGAALLFASALPAGAQMPMATDYDVNDNGLIRSATWTN